ncbi:MAG: hypothetical protein ABJA62_00645 [Luteimonas sp.]
MSLTLGLTGMDPATEAALKAAFGEANARLNGHWQLLPESDAAHVVVDMDSMYGPMSWLRLHAAGKHVIGLTTAVRTQTDFRLGRPFDGHQVAQLLREIAVHNGVDLSTKTADSTPAEVTPELVAPPKAAEPASIPAPIAPAPPAVVEPVVPSPAPPPPPPPLAAAPPSGLTPAPAPQDELPKDARLRTEYTAPPLPSAPAPPPPPRDPVFADWLAPGALHGRQRYRRGDGSALLIDAKARQYYGPAVLKPVASYFEGTVLSADFESIDEATWNRESAALGAAQPLQRLQWFGGLLAGKGELLQGYDPSGRYKLNKWPQTEREFPKHFRIATAMMKGPASLPEIAAASGIPAQDVADFVNANLITGFAELVPEPPLEPVEPPKSTSLLGRLRNR